PILKPGKNPRLAESHRPISLLPVLSKLAEKVILARLNDFLDNNNILIPEQHGFRPRLSTTHQLLRVVEFIKEGNNKGQSTAAVFLDIQKAFDRSLRERPRTSFTMLPTAKEFTVATPMNLSGTSIQIPFSWHNPLQTSRSKLSVTLGTPL
ncbi:RNA-directed DNA polymerase from mobile element jockey, partial [Trichonephila inaurata madagascariensis]